MSPAIPTLYRGVQYRSRLEARWATFFDLLGWKHQYEPYDLAGWIPDFVIFGANPVLVEIKPVFELPPDIVAEIDRAYPYCPEQSGHCEEECCDHAPQEALILGASVRTGPEWPAATLGWLRDANMGWGEAVISRWAGDESEAKNPDDILGFCSREGSFVDRITGCYDGGSWGQGCDADRVIGLWNQAGNLTQWRGKQSVTDARS